MPVEASQLTRSQRAGFRITGAFTRGLLGAVLLLPYTVRVRFMGWFISNIAARLAGFDRRVRENLALTCPDLGRSEIRRLCRAVSNNSGRSLIEMLSGDEFVTRAKATPVSGPGLAALEAAQAEGRPAIIASGHFANYDVARANLIQRGFNIGGLYRRMANPYFNEFYVKAMSNTGQPLFEQGRRGMMDLVKHLRKGGILAILNDLHAHGGAELSFFGQPAVTSLVMAELSIKYQAPIIPVWVVRQPDGIGFEIIMDDPIPFSDPETMTQDYNDRLEKMVRAHMDQWFWVHRRWKPWEGLGVTDTPA